MSFHHKCSNQQSLPHHIYQTTIVDDCYYNKRLDQILPLVFPDFSRSQLQKWLKAYGITVDGKHLKGKDKLKGGEHIVIDVMLTSTTHWHGQAIHLNIIYEDDAIIVIDKPAGMVVHPGAGQTEGTIANGLLHYAPETMNIPRAGIVHRLDKDTSGLLVTAKTLQAFHYLVTSLQNRQVKRQYEAIAENMLIAGGTVDKPIGRHPHSRIKMAVVPSGKQAITHINVIEKFAFFSRVRCTLETGRTHQIRVHMHHINAPLIGDPLYNPRLKLPKTSNQTLIQTLRDFKRQALHAHYLAFNHPVTNRPMVFQSPLPQDITTLLQTIRHVYNYSSCEH